MIPWQDFIANAKVNLALGGVTTANGVALVLSWIPEDIGKLGALFGMVLVVVSLKHLRAQTKKAQVETELLMIKIRKLKGE